MKREDAVVIVKTMLKEKDTFNLEQIEALKVCIDATLKYEGLNIEPDGMPKLGDEVFFLQECHCVKERHKCSPNAVNSKTLEIIPISSQDGVREYDGSHYTKQWCYRLYKRPFSKGYISQWGTRVFRTYEDAIDSIGKEGNYYAEKQN